VTSCCKLMPVTSWSISSGDIALVSELVESACGGLVNRGWGGVVDCASGACVPVWPVLDVASGDGPGWGFLILGAVDSLRAGEVGR
ncbi:hypothetical protein, partial [Acinetobacter baumannii]|uniref:hypothetical protein n=1 Tax=Acinetobacter baumannii TaxID=470 RepID=UPI0013D47027